jgi:hypothetical protein
VVNAGSQRPKNGIGGIEGFKMPDPYVIKRLADESPVSFPVFEFAI